MLNLVGDTYGKLRVLSLSERKEGGNRYWNCICWCATRTTVAQHKLRNGDITCCGCCWRDIISTPHGGKVSRDELDWWLSSSASTVANS